MNSTIRKTAEEMISNGFPVITCTLKGVKNQKGETEKKAFLPMGHNKMSYDSCFDWVENHIKDEHNCLVLLCGDRGAPKNLMAVDIDVPKKDEKKENGMDKWNELIEKNGEPQTVKEMSGRGGLHYIFNYDPCVKHTNGLAIDGKNYTIDVKTDGGLLYLAPTKYTIDKVVYEYVLKNPYKKLSNVPDWLKNILTPKEKKDTKAITLKKSPSPLKTKCMFNFDFDRTEVEELMALLKPEKHNSYNDNEEGWISIGMILHCIHSSLLDVWIEFSKKLDNFKEGECEYKWKTFKGGNYTIATLHYMAKKDNPTEYLKYKNRTTIEVIDKYPTKIDDDVANVFYTLHKHSFVCGQEEPRVIWFQFRDGIWCKLDGNSSVRIMFKNLIENYRIYIEYYNKKAMETADEQEKDKYDARAKRAFEVIAELKTFCAVSSYIKQCIQYFKVDKFIEALDLNKDIICFGEDVYELKTNKWRKTKPDDYCSIKMGFTKAEVEKASTTELMAILDDIFTSEETRDYVINTLADCLSGYNEKEVFHIWMGRGANGKSLLNNLMERAFGDYYGSIDVAMITNKRGKANEANPQLAKSRGKRVIVFSEPDEDQKLNTAMMKEMTGGDAITSRELYGAPITFKPQFKPFILTNTSFATDDIVDEGVKRRLDFILFKRKFVYEITYPEFERLRDDTLKSDAKINFYSASLCALLLQYWAKYGGKYSIPAEIKGDKQEYINENDNVARFVIEKVERLSAEDATEGDFISSKDLYDEYKKWDSANKKMTKKAFSNRLDALFPSALYKDRHRFKKVADAKWYEARSVYLRIKWKTEEGEFEEDLD